MILGDEPTTAHKLSGSRSNYLLGRLSVIDGSFSLFPLEHAEQRHSCRIEDLRDNQLLISCDNTLLTAYSL